jgi:hypothetical protein
VVDDEEGLPTALEFDRTDAAKLVVEKQSSIVAMGINTDQARPRCANACFNLFTQFPRPKERIG